VEQITNCYSNGGEYLLMLGWPCAWEGNMGINAQKCCWKQGQKIESFTLRHQTFTWCTLHF